MAKPTGEEIAKTLGVCGCWMLAAPVAVAVIVVGSCVAWAALMTLLGR